VTASIRSPQADVVLVVAGRSASSPWLDAPEWARAGISLLRLADDGSVPDSKAISDLIAGTRPDACLVTDDGALARVAWVLADLAQLPVFALISTDEQLRNLTWRFKPKPDLFFVSSAGLLPRAMLDDRYGSTLLAVGDPASSGGGDGPSAAEARERMIQAIARWRDGALATWVPEVSIIVPAYREARNLPIVCDRLIEVIDQNGLKAEILIVDDASPDDTYAVALAQMWRSAAIRAFTKSPPRGMGNSIRYGLQRARGSVIAITMGDGSDEVTRIPEMVRRVRDDDYGLAIGSRYRNRANYQAVPRLYRFWSMIFRYTTWALVGLRLRDYTNAFRVFQRTVFQRQGLESGGFEISPEMTFKAWFATKRVVEVDVRHLKRTSGQSNFSFLRAGPGYGKVLIKAIICRVTGRWFVLDW
jgi:dolichol-phosphate mannosyltransferase